MDEGLKQTIERVKQQNAHVLPITNMVQHVPSDIQRLIAAAERAEAAEAELGREVVHHRECIRNNDALSAALQEQRQRREAAQRESDAFQGWANTLESCGWHDAGECPYCKANDVRKSTDVLEPDVAKAVCYCGTCRRTWLETPAVRIVTVGSAVVLPADPGLKGKTHTGEGPL